jgi:hypothetical protein
MQIKHCMAHLHAAAIVAYEVEKAVTIELIHEVLRDSQRQLWKAWMRAQIRDHFHVRRILVLPRALGNRTQSRHDTPLNFPVGPKREMQSIFYSMTDDRANFLQLMFPANRAF